MGLHEIQWQINAVIFYNIQYNQCDYMNEEGIAEAAEEGWAEEKRVGRGLGMGTSVNSVRYTIEV